LLNAVELGSSADDINFSSGLGLQVGEPFGNVLFGSIRGADFRRYALEISTLMERMKNEPQAEQKEAAEKALAAENEVPASKPRR
jgi:hypothetical protein